MAHGSTSSKQLWASMQQVSSWWAAVDKQYGKEAQRHFMSAEVTFDVQAMGHGLLGLTQWLDSKAPGFELNCKKLNQNDVECAFSMLRANGSNKNPTTQDCARGITNLRYANIHSKVSRGASYEQEDAAHSDDVFKQQLAARHDVCHTRVWPLSTLEPATQPAAPGMQPVDASSSRARHLAAAVLRQVGEAPLDPICRDALATIGSMTAASQLQSQWQQLCEAADAAVSSGPWHQAHHRLLSSSAQALLKQMPCQPADTPRVMLYATAEQRQQRAASQVSNTLAGTPLCTSWVCCYMRLAWSLLRLRVFSDHTLAAEAKAAAKRVTDKQSKKQKKQKQKLLDPAGTDAEAAALQAMQPDGIAEHDTPGLELDINSTALAHLGGWAMLKVQAEQDSEQRARTCQQAARWRH